MKANELRIGNLINIDDYLTEITGVSKSTVFFNDGFQMFIAGGIEPIPLTEDWLLKFGFKKKINKRFGNAEMFQICNKYIIAKPWGENLKLFNNTLSRGFLLDVIYVHQLQNLYFALTGEELLIKDQNDN